MGNVPFVYIENTLKCNLKCTMCSNPTEHGISSMPREKIIELIDFFSTKTNKIIFSGGESLLDLNMVEYVNRIPDGKEIVLLTNGTMFHSKVFEEICSRLSEVRVSIDDMFDSESSLYRLGSSPKSIIKDMAIARKMNENMIMVVTCILNHNIVENLQKFVDYFIENEADIDIIRFIPQIYYKGRAPESLKKDTYHCMDFDYIASHIVPFLTDYISNKKYKIIDVDIQHLFSSEIFSKSFTFEPYTLNQKCCEYQKGMFINNNGDLIYCPNSQLPIANVKDITDLEELIIKRDRALVSDSHHITDISICDKYDCSTCRYMKLCGGGCPAITYNTTNDSLLPDYIKCSFNIVWEKHILPILPNRIKKLYTSALISDGTIPPFFSNIYEIVSKFGPKFHTEDYFRKGV